MSYIGWCITAILSKWPKLVVPCVRNLVPCPFDPNHCCNWWYGKVSFYKMLTPAYFQASILVSWRGGFSVPERSAPSWDSPHSFPCHFALCEPVARWHSARWVAARCLWALEVHSCCSTSRQKILYIYNKLHFQQGRDDRRMAPFQKSLWQSPTECFFGRTKIIKNLAPIRSQRAPKSSKNRVPGVPGVPC